MNLNPYVNKTSYGKITQYETWSEALTAHPTRKFTLYINRK